MCSRLGLCDAQDRSVLATQHTIQFSSKQGGSKLTRRRMGFIGCLGAILQAEGNLACWSRPRLLRAAWRCLLLQAIEPRILPLLRLSRGSRVLRAAEGPCTRGTAVQQAGGLHVV